MTPGADQRPAAGSAGTLHAWVDESMRHDDRGGGLYLLAAAACGEDACTGVRAEMRELLSRGQERLHWRDESDPRRSRIASTIGRLAVPTVVVVASPLDHHRQERARRQCMEVLYPLLVARGVSTIWQETRTPTLNQSDHKMISALRGKRLVPTYVRVEFAKPVEEPMLWIPDAVAGAVGAARTGRETTWLSEMEATVIQVEVDLR